MTLTANETWEELDNAPSSLEDENNDDALNSDIRAEAPILSMADYRNQQEQECQRAVLDLDLTESEFDFICRHFENNPQKGKVRGVNLSQKIRHLANMTPDGLVEFIYEWIDNKVLENREGWRRAIIKWLNSHTCRVYPDSPFRTPRHEQSCESQRTSFGQRLRLVTDEIE